MFEQQDDGGQCHFVGEGTCGHENALDMPTLLHGTLNMPMVLFPTITAAKTLGGLWQQVSL